MNHSDVQKYMADYLEGDLPLGRRALLDAHLDECRACAQELAGMRATISLLRSLPDPEVPHHLADDVMRRVRMGEGQQTWLDGLRSVASLLVMPRVLAPASAVMLAAGVLLATGQVQIIIPNGGSAPAPRVAANRPASSAIEVASRRLAAAPALAAVQPVGASAAEEPGVHSRSRYRVPTEPGREQQNLAVLSNPAAPHPPISFDIGSPEFAAIVELLHAHPQVPRPPLARRPQTLQVSGAASFDGGIGSLGLSRRAQAPAQSSGAPVERVLPSADEWLVLVQKNPIGFADQLAALSLAEQELWVDLLAKRAGERGSLDELVSVLRSSGSDRAQLLAEDFAVAGRRAAAGRQSAPRGESRALAD